MMDVGVFAPVNPNIFWAGALGFLMCCGSVRKPFTETVGGQNRA